VQCSAVQCSAAAEGFREQNGDAMRYGKGGERNGTEGEGRGEEKGGLLVAGWIGPSLGSLVCDAMRCVQVIMRRDEAGWVVAGWMSWCEMGWWIVCLLWYDS
jgi:hypothetical protein